MGHRFASSPMPPPLETAIHQPAQSAILPLPSLVDLMSRLALQRDPQAQQLCLDDLHDCLRYVTPLHAEALRLLERGLGRPCPQRAKGQDLTLLQALPLPPRPLPAEESLNHLLRSLTRRYREGFVRWPAGTLPLSVPAQVQAQVPPQVPDARRERIAFHEAGHAVLHRLFFPELPIEQVSIGAIGETGGYLALDTQAARPLDETPLRVQQYIAVLLGGRLAELQRFGPGHGPCSGSGADLERARNAAYQAIAHQGLDSDWGLLSLDGLSDAPCLPLPEQVRAELWGRIRAWLLTGQDLARLHLHRHWPEVERLAAELLARHTLPGAQVHALLAALPSPD